VNAETTGRDAAGLAENDAHFVARPVSVARAYEQLAGQIRIRIMAGELPEGSRLPSEAEIGREARVSRSTVREALRVLEEAGFVQRASPRILVVRRPQSDELALHEATKSLRRSNVTFDDLIEALLTLDPDLTRLATERIKPDGLAALESQLAEQERVLADPEAWIHLDDAFHVTIAEISGNAPLILARKPISALLLPTMWRFVRDERMTRAAFTFHERIVEQVRARDPDAAAFMTRKHINDFRRAWERAGLDVHETIGAVD
jgi:GntR family transcriptional regulator, transcriptional repressor for pyruvate dehydrogenase complex